VKADDAIGSYGRRASTRFSYWLVVLAAAAVLTLFADMRYLFTSPLMRQYWAAAERARSFFEPGSPEFAFAKKLDDLCRDYEVAVATAERGARCAPAVDLAKPAGLAEEAA